MQFPLVFVALASGLASLVGAAPTETTARATGAVYLCTDINFTGSCTNYGVTIGQCSDMPSAFNDNISSFGPDNGLNCCIYENWGCSGYSYCYTYPGISDLRTVGNGYINDKTSSVKCTYA